MQDTTNHNVLKGVALTSAVFVVLFMIFRVIQLLAGHDQDGLPILLGQSCIILSGGLFRAGLMLKELKNELRSLRAELEGLRKPEPTSESPPN